MLDIVNFTADYIEDWSSGSCVNGEHGANDCYTDRFQLCAQHNLPTKEAWKFMWCNFKYQACLSYNTPQAGLPATCTLEGVLSGCSNYTSMSYETLKTCATSDESAAWAKASGAAASKVGGGHPLWVFVDGKQVSDDSSGTDAWGTSVLSAVCAAAKAKGMALPAGCAGWVKAAQLFEGGLVTPLDGH